MKFSHSYFLPYGRLLIYQSFIDLDILSWVNIGPAIIFPIYHYSELVSWNHKTLGERLQLHKYEELPLYFSPILQRIDIVVANSLWVFSLVECQSIYVNTHFQLVIASVLMMKKWQEIYRVWVVVEGFGSNKKISKWKRVGQNRPPRESQRKIG